jgi:hypothetical protein
MQETFSGATVTILNGRSSLWRAGTYSNPRGGWIAHTHTRPADKFLAPEPLGRAVVLKKLHRCVQSTSRPSVHETIKKL